MGGKNPLGGTDSLTDQDGCSLDIESSGLESPPSDLGSDPVIKIWKAAWNPTSLGSITCTITQKECNPEMTVMSPLSCVNRK